MGTYSIYYFIGREGNKEKKNWKEEFIHSIKCNKPDKILNKFEIAPKNNKIMRIYSKKYNIWNGLILHRKSGPAIECFINNKEHSKDWYKYGKCHREDGPACIYASGTKEWYINDKLHREDGPAVEFFNGNKEWYKFGVIHRDDGPAIEKTNGDKEWFMNGERHRKGGPAHETNEGYKAWYRNNLLHRLKGPAIKNIDGSKEWAIDGWKCTRTQHAREVKMMRSRKKKLKKYLKSVENNV